MEPPGIKIFEARDPGKTLKYSFEQQENKLTARYEKKLKANKKHARFPGAGTLLPTCRQLVGY